MGTAPKLPGFWGLIERLCMIRLSGMVLNPDDGNIMEFWIL